MELNENKCNDNEYHNRSLAAQKSTMISVAVNILLSCVQILLLGYFLAHRINR
jgi:hypothetical protein